MTRKGLLVVAACMLLAACTSGSGGVVATEEPISVPSSPPSADVAKERPPLLPEDVDVPIAEPVAS